MARTTVDLDSGLIRELKHVAANSGQSMSRVVNQLLRDALERSQTTVETRSFSWHTVPDGEPALGFDPASREYLDLLDESS